MAAYITVGAKTDHGGTVISGSAHTLVNGIPVARKGDKVMCKKCKKVVTIVTGDPAFVIDGAPVARAGDITSCGSKLIAIQQAFAESDFDVGSITQAEPSQFPKSEASNFFDTEESTAIEIKKVSLYKNEFVPLGVPKFGETESEGLKHSKFNIEITIKQGTYSKLTILGGSSLSDIINEQTDTFTAGQTIEIEWDGFINDVYDSKWFTDKNKQPSIKVQGLNEFGGIDEHIYVLEMAFKDEKWADIIIDRNKNRINVTIRVDIESDIDTKNLSPNNDTISEIQSSSYYVITKDPIITKQNKTTQQLHNLVIEGMNKYWSRNSTTHPLIKPNVTIHGDIYELFVNTVITDKNALPKTKITFNTNSEWGRSNSFPIFRNVFYNVGYIKSDTNWNYESVSKADNNFKETFAHEIGHSIIWDYRGQLESLTHEGSSTVSQKPNSSYNYSSTGELDLMKYSKDNKPLDFFERVVANEEDVKGLLWVSRLKED